MIVLNDAFVDRATVAIRRTWYQISPDAGSCTNLEAMAMVLDANRLSSCGFSDIDNLISAAIQEHGWDRVLRFFALRIRL